MPRIDKITLFAILAFGVLFLFQCKPKNEEPKTEDLSNCEFVYDASATKLQWTAFKFTEKTGVNGTFSEYNVDGIETKKSIVESVQNVKFSINGSKVFTSVRERDDKIAKSFFGTMIGEISGYFKNIVGTDSGTADLFLTMNGVEKQVPAQFTIKNQKELELKASINLNDWKAAKSLKELNKVCSEQHTGKDKTSKLWPDVDILVTTTFKTKCEP
ncbi:MAG: YceI family protein [Leptospiraceae bacterium]|nr:YceI family protein [Leptospiraceae bacterium]MCP5493386.1 YceI family protein [Leptospiraceae bacterium]